MDVPVLFAVILVATVGPIGCGLDVVELAKVVAVPLLPPRDVTVAMVGPVGCGLDVVVSAVTCVIPSCDAEIVVAIVGPVGCGLVVVVSVTVVVVPSVRRWVAIVLTSGNVAVTNDAALTA